MTKETFERALLVEEVTQELSVNHGEARAILKYCDTRMTRDGTATLFNDVQLNWMKLTTAVPGYNGGKPQFELQIATSDIDQARAWKEVLPNLNVKEEEGGVTTFTLKRPSFLGSPTVLGSDGDIMSVETKKSLGNGSLGDVKVSHKKHPKTGRPYVCLEAIRVNEIAVFVPDNTQFENDFDF